MLSIPSTLRDHMPTALHYHPILHRTSSILPKPLQHSASPHPSSKASLSSASFSASQIGSAPRCGLMVRHSLYRVLLRALLIICCTSVCFLVIRFGEEAALCCGGQSRRWWCVNGREEGEVKRAAGGTDGGYLLVGSKL